MPKLFILDLAAAPRQRLLFGLLYCVGLLPIALSGVPWPIKIGLGLVVLALGLWSDRTYWASGKFYPLRLVYDRRASFAARRPSHPGWRMRLPGNRWLDLRLHSHFNFLDVYLVLVFRKHAPSSNPTANFLRFRAFIQARPQTIYLPCLLGDLSADQLRQLRVLARMGD